LSTRLILATLKAVAYLPMPVLHGFGSLLGVASLLSRNRRHTMQENLRQAGLYSTGMLLHSAAEFGKNILETLPIWFRPTERNLAMIKKVHGWEAVEEARAQGKGILVLSPHLGSWELVGQFVASHMPFVVLYRPPRQPWADVLMRNGRERNQARLATPDMKGVRALLASLKKGGAAGILPDQVASKGDGVWAVFFGRQAYMPVLSHRFSQLENTQSFLFVCERLPIAHGYTLRIVAISDIPSRPEEGTTFINKKIENLIRDMPAQYLWSYAIYRSKASFPKQDAE